MDIVSEVELWHKRARPTPTDADFNVQLGCHLEEVGEMLDSLNGASRTACSALDEAIRALGELSRGLKTQQLQVFDYSRDEMLDSLADQIVTAVGVGHCASMDVPQALDRVNVSNWSKFDAKGQPIFDENGKVTKGPNYKRPNLEGLY